MAAHVCTPTCGHASIDHLLTEWAAVRMDLAMGDIARIEHRQLLALDPDGRPCEVCGGRMHDHDWADIDHAGFAVACSEQPEPTTTEPSPGGPQ